METDKPEPTAHGAVVKLMREFDLLSGRLPADSAERISAALDELQLALDDLHSDLNNMARNVSQLIEAERRRSGP